MAQKLKYIEIKWFDPQKNGTHNNKSIYGLEFMNFNEIHLFLLRKWQIQIINFVLFIELQYFCSTKALQKVLKV